MAVWWLKNKGGEKVYFGGPEKTKHPSKAVEN